MPGSTGVRKERKREKKKDRGKEGESQIQRRKNREEGKKLKLRGELKYNAWLPGSAEGKKERVKER